MGSPNVFGETWSRLLVIKSDELGIPIDWPLAVIATESGFIPTAENKSTHAFGLWQKMPGHDAKGNLVKYSVFDPVLQLHDAFGFWQGMIGTFHVAPIKSRGSFYCINVAPARLRGGMYTPLTTVYDRDIHPKAYAENEWLDSNHDGVITIGDLETALDTGIKRCRPRYDAELAFAQSLVDDSPTDVG